MSELPLGNNMIPGNSEKSRMPSHIDTFATLQNTYSKIYSFRYDEALRNSWQYAQDMRQDTFITSKLNKRYLGTINKPWKIESVSQKKQAPEDVITFCENSVSVIPEYHNFQYSLKEAAWYGKQALDCVWGKQRTPDGEITNVVYHAPIMGDKVWFSFDGRPGVMINPIHASKFPESMIRIWERGTLLLLDDETLKSGQFIFQRNLKEDADYFSIYGAGRVTGTGVRDKIYWPWYLRNQSLGWIMEYMQRVGTDGVIVFYYEESNTASEQAAYQNASLIRERNCLVVPRRVEKGSETAATVDHIPFSGAGIEHLRSLVESYYERHIEAMILGGNRIATTSAAAKDSYDEDFKLDFTEILKWDAMCYDSAMNSYYLPRLLEKNGLEQYVRTVKYRTVVPDPTKIEMMTRLSKMLEKVELEENEVREQTGFRNPREGAAVVGGIEQMKELALVGKQFGGGSESGESGERE